MKAAPAAACAAALMTSLAGTAHALLLEGETLRVQVHYPTLADVVNGQNVVVGPGPEFQSVLRSEVIDISDTRIRFANRRDAANLPAEFNGYSFFDVFASIEPIVSVTINPETNLAGFDASDIAFDGDNIFVNFQGTAVTTPTVVTLDLNVSEVPAPSGLPLTALAFALMARARRRR